MVDNQPLWWRRENFSFSEGTNALVEMKAGEGEGRARPERRGGGRSERRTVCEQTFFSTRRPPPYSSLPFNPQKWRPESQSTLSNQLASLTPFHLTRVVHEL